MNPLVPDKLSVDRSLTRDPEQTSAVLTDPGPSRVRWSYKCEWCLTAKGGVIDDPEVDTDFDIESGVPP